MTQKGLIFTLLEMIQTLLDSLVAIKEKEQNLSDKAKCFINNVINLSCESLKEINNTLDEKDYSKLN